MVHDDGQSDTCSNHLSLTLSELDDIDSAGEVDNINEAKKLDKRQSEYCKISANADGGPRSRVCARKTLRSATHRH